MQGVIQNGDIVLYDKIANLNDLHKIRGSYIALMDPYSNKNILIRKLIALPNQWICRKDDGGYIKVPNWHIWIETEGDHIDDSLSKFGPITAKLLLGKARYIVWPPWRFVNLEDMNKFSLFNQNQSVHSSVYTDNQVRLMFEMDGYGKF